MALLEESATVEQVLEGWRGQGIKSARFELPDMHGTSRSKNVPIERAGRYARDGLNMYGGAVVLDSRSDVVPGTRYNVDELELEPPARPPAEKDATRPPLPTRVEESLELLEGTRRWSSCSGASSCRRTR